jgi:N-acetylmuramoyl-L-alanine amidase CwlA
MMAYDIPRERVIRHYDVTGKLCPGVPGWNDGPLFDTAGKQTNRKSDSHKWAEFLAAI